MPTRQEQVSRYSGMAIISWGTLMCLWEIWLGTHGTMTGTSFFVIVFFTVLPIGLLSAVISLFAPIIPSWHATRTEPVEEQKTERPSAADIQPIDPQELLCQGYEGTDLVDPTEEEVLSYGIAADKFIILIGFKIQASTEIYVPYLVYRNNGNVRGTCRIPDPAQGDRAFSKWENRYAMIADMLGVPGIDPSKKV